MVMNRDKEISALMDGELAPTDSDKLIDELQRDAGLRRSWERYHLIGDALQSHLPDRLGRDFAGRVAAALADEPVVLAPRQVSRKVPKVAKLPPLLKHMGGFAVAASVTAVTILGIQSIYQQESAAPQVASAPSTSVPSTQAEPQLAEAVPIQSSPAPQLASISSVPAAEDFAQVISTSWGLGQPAVESKLNRYLTNHNKYTTYTGMQGMYPQARIVGYETSNQGQ